MIKNKKIIFSNYDDIQNPYYGGGGAIAIHEIAKRLISGYEIVAITGRYPGSKDIIRDGIQYKRIGPSFFGGKLGQLIYQLYLPFYVITEKYDLWLESFTPPFSISLLPLFSKKPVIGIVHMLSGEDMRRKYKLPFDLIEKLGLRLYKNFIVMTQDTKIKILNNSPKADIIIIPNGVIPLSHLTKTKSKIKTILFVGRIEINQKGLDLLIDAFHQVANKYKVQLVIAGSGNLQEVKRLEEYTRSKNLQKKVRIVGRISGKLKRFVLLNATCLVVSSRFETFSISALEALANGIPLVTFPIDGLKWIPKSCRVIASTIVAESLALSLSRIINNKSLQKNLIASGKKIARSFNWDVSAKKYDNFINTILQLTK
jgi:glycosyltransferase involved in cell wall biosynthesis